ALIVLGIVLGAHIFGIDGLYVSISGYDIMMHFLGGAGIGLFLIALLKSFKADAISMRNVIWGVLFIGLIWELFEIYFRITGHPLWTKLYYVDTVKDLINDGIGGAVVSYLYV